MKMIQHPNIVKLYDSYEMEGKDNKYGFLFMEKCSKGYEKSYLELPSISWKKIKEDLYHRPLSSKYCLL